MKILILGSNGQLGKCLKDQFKKSEYDVYYASRDNIDISDLNSTKKKIMNIKPNIIVNAAAYTAVDDSERFTETANLINHKSLIAILDACKMLNCWIIHISTDYVFDGLKNSPYKEEDPTNPQSVYGTTKLHGELLIKNSGCNYLIIRTAWVFSEYGNNFMKTMLRLGKRENQVRVIDDQIGCPTYAQDIAKAIKHITPQLNDEIESGIFHYCGENICSWYDFASVIFNKAYKNKIKIPKEIIPISANMYPSTASRPAYSVLDCSKIKKIFSVNLSNWEEGITKVIAKYPFNNL